MFPSLKVNQFGQTKAILDYENNSEIKVKLQELLTNKESILRK